MIIILPELVFGSSQVWRFTDDSIRQSTGEYLFRYNSLAQININKDFSLPVKEVYLETDKRLVDSDFLVIASRIIGRLPHELGEFDNGITGVDNTRRNSPLHSRERLGHAVYAIDELSDDGFMHHYAVTILPITLDKDDNLVFNSAISCAAETQSIAGPKKLFSMRRLATNHDSAAPEESNGASGIPLNCCLLIITSPQLAANFKPLVDFKKIIGASTAVALTDSIYNHYEGIDKQEQIRNYLKDFYASGGKYVLLGGDDDIIPPRYLFYYNVDFQPSDTNDLMPSDLYFADLNGEWDKDGDGVWGEPTQDAPDIIPELMVGRIPVKTGEGISNYCAKEIAYCSNPGNGSYDHLTKALFFTADEMRDYPEGGQHKEIASVYPSNFAIDTFTTVETPSGEAPAPTNFDGAQSISKISEGFGIINIVTHGRADGFVVRSAEYCQWPMSYILTSWATGWHGTTENLARNNKVSFYYSLACNVGGYDLDMLNGASWNMSLVEQLIAADSAGAVGMVANSRWGWVYSSYLLQESFMNHLFTDANGSPTEAMYLSWLDYPYFRDLIYGQNYFGDPSINIYTSQPGKLRLSLRKRSDNLHVIEISSDSTPIAGAKVVLSRNGTIMKSGTTGESGNWTLSYAFNPSLVYEFTVVKSGYTVLRETYLPSIIADVNDGEDRVPSAFQLEQNYPNPFNPRTTIEYSIPARMEVTFEIYNLLGQKIYETGRASMAAGGHSIAWDGKDNSGREVPSGIYFYRLTAGEYCQTKKMVLLR